MIEIYTLTASSSSSSSSSNGTKNKSDELDASSFDLRSARSKRIELCTSVVAKLSPIQHFSRLLTPLPLLLFPALTPTSALSLKKEASWEIPEEEEVRSSRRGWTNSTQTKEKFLGGKYEKDGWTSHDDESNAPMLLHFIFFFFFFFFRAILPLKFIFIFFTSNKNPFRHEGWKKKIWAADFVLEKSKRRTIFSKHGQTVGQPIVDFSEALTYSPMPYRGFPLPSFIFFFAIPPTSCGFILPGPPWIWRLIRLYWTVSTGRAPPSKLMGFPLVPSFPFLCVYIPTFLPSFLPSFARA